jgi:hypothetical protein
MAKQPAWAAYTTFAYPQRPDKPFAGEPPSIFRPIQRHVPREASITPMYQCDAPAGDRPDSLKGLVEDLSKFTTLETVRGIAQFPPSSIVGPFERSRRSPIHEEGENEAPDENMSVLCTARFQSVYEDGMSDGHGDEGRTCSMAVASTVKGRCDGDGWVSEERPGSSQYDAYSAMSLGD